jgi:murein DD-endopeptidase MepM/ murein hydrolase activator NlpD
VSAPDLQVAVEPSEGGSVVYGPMASPAVNKPEQGRLMLRLAISNLGSDALQMESLSVTPVGPGSYSSKTLPLKWFWTTNGVEQSAVLTIGPSETALWWFQHPTDNLIFDDSPAPTTLELGLTAVSFSDPATFVFPLAAHVAPTATGAYLFPAAANDLDPDEYWETNGAGHGMGAEGSQGFAYDLVVWTDSGSISPWLRPATDGTKNKHFRAWGKPVHAMAAGTVNQVLFDVPTNPKPLTGPDWDAQFAAQKSATWGKYLTDHGYDYNLDQPHAGAGNHLYIQHGDEIVLYAHLQPHKIPQALRTPGATVQAGDFLGPAGNSGNSSAPHLHIHAIRGTQAEDGSLRPLVFAPFTVLETDLISASPQPWMGVLSGRSLPPLDAFIWPAYSASNHRPGIADAAIDPLALILREDIYILLTLPDPPPEERLLRELERELAETTPAVRRDLAQRVDMARSFLASVERAVETDSGG